jgi:hypothetical protein
MHRPDRSPSSTAVACEPDVANHFLTPVFCFSIEALPDAGVMARVLEQFAKRNLVPTRWHSDVIESDAMQIDIQIVGLAQTLGQDIARCLRSIVGVHGVLTAGKAAQPGRRLHSL